MEMHADLLTWVDWGDTYHPTPKLLIQKTKFLITVKVSQNFWYPSLYPLHRAQ